MWCRKRIDIGWSDLLFGCRHAIRAGNRSSATQAAESSLAGTSQTLACLSVRSGFDLMWMELRLPAGSEVLMSAVTIRDMPRIVTEHGLIPVPVDLDPAMMKPDLEALRRAITSKTRAIVVAHLFGAILELDDIAAIAAEHNLLFIEDCAQAFDGRRYPGHSAADVVMFSFGPIKTATALAGGLMIIRNAELLRQMRATQATWPEQTQAEFRRRLLTYGLLKLVSGKTAFSILVRLLRLLGKDLDKTLNGAVRNFPADRFFQSLRRQPCPALLLLISRRILTFDEARQDRRSRLGHQLVGALTGQLQSASPQCLPSGPAAGESRLIKDEHDHYGTEVTVPSVRVARHTWWVFPLSCANPEQLIDCLREAGFDATCVSQLQAVPAPLALGERTPAKAKRIVKTMVFLPFYPEMPQNAALQMAGIVAKAIGRK